jgi:hypothetical protein
MKKRNLTSVLLRSLSDAPVALLMGPRQVGKSTLVECIAENEHPADYFTLDSRGVYDAAAIDPEGFVDGLDDNCVIDEVQRVEELFLAIKRSVDKKRKPGKFLLTGSANPFFLPGISESLAGRMEIHTLWPFSQGELSGDCDGFVDKAFSNERLNFNSIPNQEKLSEILVRGGYPEIQERDDPDRRDAWFESYLSAMIHRDLRDLKNIKNVSELSSLLSVTATRATELLNVAGISSNIGIPQTTLKRYLALLEAGFLLIKIPSWRPNLGKRLTKSAKIFLTDSGLLCHLLGCGVERLLDERKRFGRVLENFVAMELHKQIGWSQKRVELYHFRTYNGEEVDFVLESADGTLVGVEVKSRRTVRGDDFENLRFLNDQIPEKFHRGIVLYTGEEFVPVSQNLEAYPLSALWSEG